MEPIIYALIEDTRNQVGKHKNIHRYCEEHGIKIVRSKLLVGDYMLTGEGTGGISVDTKMDVGELAACCHTGHERFRNELIRAKECGIQLIVLTEEVLPEGRLDKWKSPIGRDGQPKYKFDPVALRKSLITMQERYGVKFRFCDGRSTGKVLLAYLKGDLK